MCGLIATFTDYKFPNESAFSAIDQLKRRGPDGQGSFWGDGVFLGHTRLSVIDLDTRASQPMRLEGSPYLIVFNGEIYNFQSLRIQLLVKGCKFSTNSDTEVLLHLYVVYGKDMVSMLHGMYAFVIWDENKKIAFVARDPYGIKPLYLANLNGGGFALASQVKTLLATKLVSEEVDKEGINLLYLFGSLPEPYTTFKFIKSIEAGSSFFIDKNGICEKSSIAGINESWVEAELSEYEVFSAPAVKNIVNSALSESIRRHLVSDVPMGIFVSGGIDSSALVGLAVQNGAKGITGITVVFDEYVGTELDEGGLATLVAKYYGIAHHIRRVKKDEFYDDLPAILDAMDQPSIDGINTWYACKAAAELGIKVVISGVGGDELFYGYQSFNDLPKLVRLWRIINKMPGAKFISNKIFARVANLTKNDRWAQSPSMLTNIVGAWLLKRSINPISKSINTSCLQYTKNGLHINNHFFLDKLPNDHKLALGMIESTMYLRNQLLRDADWASMYHGIELRTPLVDDFLLRNIKKVMKYFHLFPNKSLLADSPINSVPSFIAERKKTGFGIPIREWMGDRLELSMPGDKWNPWLRMVLTECYKKYSINLVK